MCTKHGELFKELLDTSDILQDIARKSVENQPVMEVSAKEALEMLLGRVDLSQRGYNNLRDILAHFIYQIIKTMEINGTNLDDHHLGRIVRNIRIKQFVYPESIIPREVTVKCSACNQVGHNKKNKSCPLHEIHPELTFSDSEDEEEIENDH